MIFAFFVFKFYFLKNIEAVSESVLSEIMEKFFVYALALKEVKIEKKDFKVRIKKLF